MKSLIILSLAALTRVALTSEVHGSGAQGSVMGPVAFLWPADRTWSADHDNIAPCGSNAAIGNRTQFPIGSLGSIELTIADEAYNLALRIAYGNNPSTQSAFQAIKSNITELEPGHACYSVENTLSALTTGANATLQLEYWANDSNKNESFFACADITFVEALAFDKSQVPCFNVTSSEFEAPEPSSSPVPEPAASDVPAADESVEEKSGGGLSGGAKAGIAIAAIVGAAIVGGGIFLAMRRKRQSKRDVETVAPAMAEKKIAASIGSAETAH